MLSQRRLYLLVALIQLSLSAEATADVKPLLVLEGEHVDDRFGISVASAGDVNGDGFIDLVIGAQWSDVSGDASGRAYVYFGGNAFDEYPDLVIDGEAASSRFGWPVGSAGDFNGDGYDDFGASAWANDAGGNNAGRAYIYYGGPGLDSLSDVLFTGQNSNDELNWFSKLDHFDSDEISDFVVGADKAENRFGRVYVHFGNANSDNLPDLVFGGEGASDGFGQRLDSAGDMNGDGFTDVLVGANANDAGGMDAGRAYVYFGGPNADTIPDVIMTGEAPGDWFGFAVAGGGDVNGDGYDDILVGAYRNDAGGDNAGRVYLYFGGPSPNNVADLVFDGEAAGDVFGKHAAFAGDINYDGYDDIVVGSPGSQVVGDEVGKVYVYLGGEPMDSIADMTMVGDTSLGEFGFSVSAAGDLNGDGFLEICVGAPTAGAGRAYVYSFAPRRIEVPVDFSTIGDALSAAWWGDTVAVAPGTYNEHSLVLPGGVSLRGSGPDDCIIDAAGLGPGVICSQTGPGTSISGLRIENGSAIDGAGVQCFAGSLTIKNCVFCDNTASHHGGGIYLNGGSVSIERCFFMGNTATDGGGLLARYGSEVLATRCTFVGNTLVPNGWGGGVCCYDTVSTTIDSCLFYRNSAYEDNGLGRGGGLMCYDSNASVRSCTFVFNAAGNGAGGVDCTASSSVSLENTIVAFSTLGCGLSCGENETVSVSCSDIFGNAGGDWLGCLGDYENVDGNISEDPEFCDPENDDYRIASGYSPCAPHTAPNWQCELLGALPVGCEAWQGITSIEDVPNDQGGQVRISWDGHSYDQPSMPYVITEYSLYRRIDEAPQIASGNKSAEQLFYPPGQWDFITTVPASGENSYAVVAQTLCDSSIVGGLCWSHFFVRTHTDSTLITFDSEIDSGYSVDNLAPAPPGGLRWDGPDLLAWNESGDEDFDFFTVYGSDADSLDGSAAMVGQTPTLGMDVSGGAFSYYYVTTTDFSGNEGAPATIQGVTTGTPGSSALPLAFSLEPGRPNPFRGGTTIGFSLPVSESVSLAIYDASGRRVRTLVDRAYPPGQHAIEWGGANDAGRPVAAGVYFAKIEAGDFRETRRLVLLR